MQSFLLQPLQTIIRSLSLWISALFGLGSVSFRPHASALCHHQQLHFFVCLCLLSVQHAVLSLRFRPVPALSHLRARCLCLLCRAFVLDSPPRTIRYSFSLLSLTSSTPYDTRFSHVSDSSIRLTSDSSPLFPFSSPRALQDGLKRKPLQHLFVRLVLVAQVPRCCRQRHSRLVCHRRRSPVVSPRRRLRPRLRLVPLVSRRRRLAPATAIAFLRPSPPFSLSPSPSPQL